MRTTEPEGPIIDLDPSPLLLTARVTLLPIQLTSSPRFSPCVEEKTREPRKLRSVVPGCIKVRQQGHAVPSTRSALTSARVGQFLLHRGSTAYFPITRGILHHGCYFLCVIKGDLSTAISQVLHIRECNSGVYYIYLPL